jgi:hypothetical protein
MEAEMMRIMVAEIGPYARLRFVLLRLHQWRQRFRHFGYRMHRKKRRAFLRKVVGRPLANHEAAHCDCLDNVPDAISAAMMAARRRR